MRSTSRVYINHELPAHMREYSVWTELRFTSTPDPRWFNRYWCLHFSTAPCATAKAVVCCIGNVSYVLPTMHVLVGISAQNKCFPHGLRFTPVSGTNEALKQAVTTGKGLALLG